MKEYKIGDIVEAKTHAELLNKLFGMAYKGWMKTAWNYSENEIVWMPALDWTERTWKKRNGKEVIWRNRVDGNRIIEEHMEGEFTDWNDIPAQVLLNKRRIVFSVHYDGNKRIYKFQGVYKYNEKDSDINKSHCYDRISDRFSLVIS